MTPDYNVQIEGVKSNNGLPCLNVMGPTESRGIISFWIEDADGEAAIDLSHEAATKLKTILDRVVENSIRENKRQWQREYRARERMQK